MNEIRMFITRIMIWNFRLRFVIISKPSIIYSLTTYSLLITNAFYSLSGRRRPKNVPTITTACTCFVRIVYNGQFVNDFVREVHVFSEINKEFNKANKISLSQFMVQYILIAFVRPTSLKLKWTHAARVRMEIK